MTCEIIMDLIPMYADRSASRETCQLVEKHIKKCPSCRRFLNSCLKTEKKGMFNQAGLEKLRGNLRSYECDIPSVDAEFARLSSKLKKRKLRMIIISSIIAAGMLAYIVADIVNTVKQTYRKMR